MLIWRTDADLSGFNTLRLPCRTRAFAIASAESEIREAFERARNAGLCVHVLGGGSNVVLPPWIDGLVLGLASATMPMLPPASAAPPSGEIRIRLPGGLDWDAAVQGCAAAGYWGIENLALVPGRVGAAPVQNIGAYGQELADRCVGVRAFDRDREVLVELDAHACAFAYRDSRFRRAPERWLITHVDLRLTAEGEPDVAYPVVEAALAARRPSHPAEMASVIREIRRRRLPDPRTEPNAGSFFKNPVITRKAYEALLERWPDCPGRAVVGEKGGDDATPMVKVPAAWLIERAGWKGRREGGLECSARHALVLVHHGGADGFELLAFADRIRTDVAERFDVVLEAEPVRLGWDAQMPAD